MRRVIRRRRIFPKHTPSYKKTLMSILVILAALWISWSYCLATAALLLFENADPLTTLSERVCVTILGSVIAYAVASTTENISKYGFVGKQEQNNDYPVEENPDAEG